jgi:hypothetical protein
MSYKLLIATVSIVLFATYAYAGEKEDLAKKSQNPVGNIISVPIEYWHYDGIADDASADALVFKPVYPMGFEKVTLINRFIVPFMTIDAKSGGDYGNVSLPPTNSSESGLGNIQYQGFITPAEPGKVIWGAGPVFDFPTHSSRLGSEKWSAGVGALVLTMPGKWVLGFLVQNIWSYAGPSDAPDVNKFVFQYFVNYNLSNGWYLTSTPVITSDWEKPSDQRWTVPFGGGIGKLARFGNQPVDFKLQAFSIVEKPEGGPEWSLQFAVKFLFPK